MASQDGRDGLVVLADPLDRLGSGDDQDLIGIIVAVLGLPEAV